MSKLYSLSLPTNSGKDRNMQIITSREFRANQNKYFDMAERETIFVSRRNARPIIINVADDDEMLSEGELLSLQKGLEDIKAGRVYEMLPNESLTDFIKRIENV